MKFECYDRLPEAAAALRQEVFINEQGFGKKLMEYAEDRIRQLGGKSVTVHAQVQAAEFYGKTGYKKQGGVFDEEGCPHIIMTKPL